MKDDTKIVVDIELQSDALAPQVKCLAFVDEDGGQRITSAKASGSWNPVKKFRCSFTLKELKQYMIKQEDKK